MQDKMIKLTFITYLVVGISGYLIKVPTLPTPKNFEDIGIISTLDWIHKQKVLLPLFENVCEESTNPIVITAAQKFNIDAITEGFQTPKILFKLRDVITTQGLLPKGEIFTEYDANHMNELKMVYQVLYDAKDFETFYTVAAWARQNLNCGIFVDAIYLAVSNRRDTGNLSVPGPYEVLPNYFISKDTVVAASYLLAGENVTPSDNIQQEGNIYLLKSNYTSNLDDKESNMSYFLEDIGLNTFYFLKKLLKAPWNNNPMDMENRFGENLYHFMKQMQARYELERYANELPEVEGINWDSAILGPYDPNLVYSNGNDFSHRRATLNVTANDDVTFLRTIENNLEDIVIRMAQSGNNKTIILNNLMEILVTGSRSYETLARLNIGKDISANESGPSVIQHYMTSLRDPVLWKLNKKILDLVDKALSTLPSYSRNELYFPGVEVVNAEVKKIMTNFDLFYTEVTDSLKTFSSYNTYRVKVGQTRLNHKPFTIKLNITSLVNRKGLVKIYLGPKMLPGEYSSKKNLFLLIDEFEMNLKVGNNIISKTSQAEDLSSLRTIQQRVENAEFGVEPSLLENIQSLIKFPSRLILPKGKPSGLSLQMFVFVAPLVKSSTVILNSIPKINYNLATLSPGYPLDMKMDDNQLFDLPNSLLKDVIVTHKAEYKAPSGASKFNSPKPGNSYYSSRPNASYGSSRPGSSFSSRPEFTYRKPEIQNSDSEKQYFNDEKDLNSAMLNNDQEPFEYIPEKGEYTLKDGMMGEDILTVDSNPRIFNKTDQTENKLEESANVPIAEALVYDIETLSTSTESSFFKTVLRLMEPKQKQSNNLINFETLNSTLLKPTNLHNDSNDVLQYISTTPDIFSYQTTETVKQDFSLEQKKSFDYKTKKFDYKANRFDYKAKKAQLGKKNNKVNEITIITDNDNKKEMDLNIKEKKEPLIDDTEGNSQIKDIISVKSNIDNEPFSETQYDVFENVNPEPVSFRLVMPTRRVPTLFDYLFYNIEFLDESEEKVYE